MDYADLYATYATTSALIIAGISMIWAIVSCVVLKAFIKFAK